MLFPIANICLLQERGLMLFIPFLFLSFNIRSQTILNYLELRITQLQKRLIFSAEMGIVIVPYFVSKDSFVRERYHVVNVYFT